MNYNTILQVLGKELSIIISPTGNPDSPFLKAFVFLAVIAMPSQVAVALPAIDVRQIARSVTVQIQGENGTWGSGVIFKREKNTYYVLTCHHVVDSLTKYTVFTPDRRSHTIANDEIVNNRLLDIALVKFQSSNIYKLAKISNSHLLKIGTPLYIAGFAKSSLGFEVLFRRGRVIANSDRSAEYGLIYTNNSQSGMSGGGIFDRDGKLVGIQGRGEVNPFYRDAETVITGNARGIAINKVLQTGWISKEPLNSSIKTTIYPKADDFYVSGLQKQKNQNYPGAIADYNRSIQLNPRYIYAYYSRGDAYYQLGKYKSSFNDFTRAIRLNLIDPDIYNYKGLTRVKLGDYRGAIADYTAAIALNPKYYYAYGNRADILYKFKQYRSATSDYTTAINLAPQSPHFYRYRAYALYELGKRNAAIQSWRVSQVKFPQQQDRSLDLAIAVGLYATGRTQEALELAQVAIEQEQQLANWNRIKTLGWGNRLLADARQLFQHPQIRDAIANLKA